MSLPAPSNTTFWSAYSEADRDLRVLHAKVGCVLALILMPAGSTLDWFVYPDLFWRIFEVRWLADLAILPIFLALFTRFGRRNVHVLGGLWPLIPAVTISWMIAISEGAHSPYYAGLNLVIIIASALMPYTWIDALTVSFLTIVMYVMGCAAHHLWLPNPHAFSMADLYGNLYFIALTAIITTTSSHYFSRRRVAEFHLRWQIDAQHRELQDSYAKLAELDRARSQFFANISHELRTPLTLIIAPLEDTLVHARQLPAATAEALGIARQNALRLLRLINDLLEMVRLDLGAGSLRKEAIDLSVFLPGIVDSVRYLAEAKGLQLTCQGNGQPLPVEADPARLEKITLNLLTNAMKFTPSGGEIAMTSATDGKQAIITLSDTGVGIPAAALPRIFDRFHQVDGSSTRRYQGMGLGLALVRQLVVEHNGDIDVASTEGKGTTVTVRFPLTSTAVAPTPVPVSISSTVSAKPDTLERIYRQAERRGALPVGEDTDAAEIPGPEGAETILIVDDEPDMRRYLVGLFKGRYHLLQANDGGRALALAQERKPSLILLDMMLPTMDGLQVCAALRQDKALVGMKIVLLTARIDEATKISALERGADDFLTKPFSSIEVTTRITNHLRIASLQRDLAKQVTDLEAALRRVGEAEAQLVQSEKLNALGKMSAGLLHEINNPLNFALQAVDASRDVAPKDQADLKEYLVDAAEGMQRIKTIITDLRVFAYPEGGGSGVGVCTVDEALDLALRFCSQDLASIPVERRVSPKPVQISRSQLCQVLTNLISNAAQAVNARRDGPRNIVISATPEQKKMRITLRDAGTGIPTESLSRIFDPFFTTRDVGKGMGLGLSICHTIIRNHHGTISAQSEPGQWTEITFDIPLQEAAS